MIPFNPALTNPGLSDILNEWKKNIFLTMNCHAVGTVKSFDSDKRTVTVTINYTKTFYQQDSIGNFNPKQVDYPVLMDVPVLILSGGTGMVTMPIDEGDQCLILFNDRDIDNWFSGANSGPVNSGRLHALADGIALIGLFPANKSIDDYDTSRVRVQNGTTYVGVGADKIKLANDDTTLNTLLQDLITDIRNLITQISLITVSGVVSGGAVSGPPVNAAAISAISTQLGTLATQIGGLLE